MNRISVGPPDSGRTYFLRLLGSPGLETTEGARPEPVPRRRLALLALLALADPPGLTRDKLIGLLWPDRPEPSARHSLADIVYRLRLTLGDGVLASEGELISLDRAVVGIDCITFQDALTDDDLPTALALYRGPFLDGFHCPSASHEFEAWVDRERARFEQSYEEAIERLAEAAEAGADSVEAIGLWRRLLRHDPANSRVVLRLMQALVRAGDPANAIQLAHEHEDYLAGQLALELPVEIRRFVAELRHESVSAAAPGTAPADARPSVHATNSRHDAAVPDTAGVSAGDDQAPGRSRRRRPMHLVVAIAAISVLGFAALYLGGFPGGWSDDLPAVRSILVLPLANVSANEDDQYLANGLTDALIGELGRIGALEVISRTTAMQYQEATQSLPEIAEELGVDAVMEGSVLRAGDSVQINLRLVDGRTDRQLWQHNYVEAIPNVITLQRRVSREVAERIHVTLSPAVRARLSTPAYVPDPDAFEAYLKGRHHLNRWRSEDAPLAIRFFEEAVALDPGFALAHAALAEGVCMLLPSLFLDLALEKCEPAALRAIELDEGLPAAHIALAWARIGQWDWQEAEAELQRAIELNPSEVFAHMWYGWLLALMLRLDEAEREATRAEELDPLNLFVKMLVAGPLMYGHRYDDGLAKMDELLQLNPDYGGAYLYKSGFYVLKRMPEEALEAAHQAGLRIGQDVPQVIANTAWAHAQMGEEELALQTISRIEELYGPLGAPGMVAIVYSELGREDEALNKIEEGYRARNLWLPNITSWPHLDSLRDHPRFRAVRSGMGLP